jgi:tetratricopeptide (TPR) repeat protein
MLNVQELERQWLRYKIKSFLPKISLLFALLVIAIVIIVIFLKNDEAESDTANEATTNQVAKVDNSKQLSPKQNNESLNNINTGSSLSNLEVKETTPPKTQSQITLTPSLNFIDTLKEIPQEVAPKPVLQPVEEKKDTVEVEEHKHIPLITQPNRAELLQSSSSENPVVEEEVKSKKTHSNFSINIKEEEADIQEVITRFKNNKNPALSLFVAKRFYAIKNYHDAYNYALMTNNINSDIEESWLIAAKSLYKLGKKEESIRLLNEFINKSHSIRGTMILEQIKNGTLQ